MMKFLENKFANCFLIIYKTEINILLYYYLIILQLNKNKNVRYRKHKQFS